MSAPRGGSFATLLLVVPLAAIPLMAIFGIPDLARLSASTADQLPEIVREPFASRNDEASVSSTAPNSYRSRAADLFAAPSAGTSVADAGSDAPSWDGDAEGAPIAASIQQHRPVTSSGSAGAAPHQSLPRPMQTAAIELTSEAAPQQPVAASAPATSTGLTWREAARRLEEIGITDYRLERAQGTDEFLFVCRFSPGTDARIVQRFEAQSTEPLAAVEDVLTQVDRWLEHRYAESRAWVRR